MSFTDNILDLYQKQPEPNNIFTNYYSIINDNNESYGIDDIYAHVLSSKAGTKPVDIWDITVDHNGFFPVKKRINVFSEAIVRDSIKPLSIINSQNPMEKLNFKHHDHLISIEMNGDKRIYDLFDIYKKSKNICFKEKKKNFFSRMFF